MQEATLVILAWGTMKDEEFLVIRWADCAHLKKVLGLIEKVRQMSSVSGTERSRPVFAAWVIG